MTTDKDPATPQPAGDDELLAMIAERDKLEEKLGDYTLTASNS